MQKHILGAAFLGCALLAAPGMSWAAERAFPPSAQPSAGGPQERAGIDLCSGNGLRCFGRDDSSPGSRRLYDGPATDIYDIAPADAYPASLTTAQALAPADIAPRTLAVEPASATTGAVIPAREAVDSVGGE